jgi:hypothetical protein
VFVQVAGRDKTQLIHRQNKDRKSLVQRHRSQQPRLAQHQLSAMRHGLEDAMYSLYWRLVPVLFAVATIIQRAQDAYWE